LIHLLFVDDIILFGSGSILEFQEMKNILDLFCFVEVMQVNMENLVVLINDLQQDVAAQLKECFLSLKIHLTKD